MKRILVVFLLFIFVLLIGCVGEQQVCEYNDDNSIKKTTANEIIEVTNDAIILSNDCMSEMKAIHPEREFIVLGTLPKYVMSGDTQ